MLYALLDRVYGKWARRHAQSITFRYQRMMFTVYLTKYVKKHVKLRTRDSQEHPELLAYIDQYSSQCAAITLHLSANVDGIVSALCDAFCVDSKGKMTYYHPRYAPARRIVRDRATEMLASRIPSSRECANVMEDIVDMAEALRFGFAASDTAAKTKIREHWIQRPPHIAFFVVVVIMLRVFFGIYTNNFQSFDTEDVMYLIFTVLGLSSIYMVYLRVPQSICAEAKKSAQEVYMKYKIDLQFQLLDDHGDETEFMRTEASHY